MEYQINHYLTNQKFLNFSTTILSNLTYQVYYYSTTKLINFPYPNKHRIHICYYMRGLFSLNYYDLVPIYFEWTILVYFLLDLRLLNFTVFQKPPDQLLRSDF